jgi:hypothetical protein
MTEKIKNAKPLDKSMYTSWDDASSRAKAFKQMSEGVATSQAIGGRAKAASLFSGVYLKGGGFRRQDYSFNHPEEEEPQSVREAIAASLQLSQDSGIVSNVFNLMTEFVCQGIELVHPDARSEAIYQEWAKKIGLAERSERFVSLLFRASNVVAQRLMAKLKAKDVKNLQKGQADADIEVTPPPEVSKREIPMGYYFHHPLSVEVIGSEDLSLFAGEVSYGIRITNNLSKKIKQPGPDDKYLVQLLPDNLIQAVNNGQKVLPLDQNKVSVYHYKKDDWQAWAMPILKPIFKDLLMLDKLKLADLAALDGAVSHVRIWKLGSLEHKLAPNPAAFEHLAEQLALGVGGGSMDLVWGPDIELLETKTELYQFLGSEKYGPTLLAIYDGLGIPAPATSSGGKTPGFGANFLSMKTLTERLSYARKILIQFWETEIRIIQKALGLAQPAQLRFARISLSDEAAEKALLIQLVDRGVMSIETLLERFGELPEIERVRIIREQKLRDKGKLPPLAGPWYNPQQEFDLKKIALQSGVHSPSEVGLDLNPRKDGEQSALDIKNQHQLELTKQKGEPQQGRPINSRDKNKRKTRKISPQTGKSVSQMSRILANMNWARAAYEEVSKIVNPWYLSMVGKANMRSLSEEEFGDAENLKFAVLCDFDIYSEINEENLVATLNRELHIPDKVQALCNKTIAKFTEKNERQPTVDETRNVKSWVYALWKGNLDNGED